MLGNVYLTEKKLSSYAMFSSNTVQVKEQQSNSIESISNHVDHAPSACKHKAKGAL